MVVINGSLENDILYSITKIAYKLAQYNRAAQRWWWPLAAAALGETTEKL